MNQLVDRRRWEFSAVSGLTVLAWYALPDVVRSRGVRGVVKTGLLGVTAAGAAMVPEIYPGAAASPPEPRVEISRPALIAVAAGATVAATAATVWAEKAIFARGERRRARGVRWAHTPFALVLALGTAALAGVDWSSVAREAREARA